MSPFFLNYIQKFDDVVEKDELDLDFYKDDI